MLSKKSRAYSFFILSILALFNACQIESLDPHARIINKYRYTKDSLFKLTQESPFDEKEKVKFFHLFYYEPNRAFEIKANMEVFTNPDTVEIKASRGELRYYIRYGKLVFKINNKNYSLFAYQDIENPSREKGKIDLFIPFTDVTNQDETYHGGRYLELIYSGEKEVLLDFNYAYNPYCNYTPNYSCPIPPKENNLEVRIEAGEKNYDPFFM